LFIDSDKNVVIHIDMNIAAATEKYHTLNNQIEKMCQDFEDHFTPLVYKEIKNGKKLSK